MNPPPISPVLTRWNNRVLIAVLAVVVWLPTLDTFFGFDWAPRPNEKRLPAAFPTFESGWGGIKKYLAGLEAYFNDHFGCRKCLVQWNNKWKWDVFRDASVRQNTIVGRDGWLYLADCQMVDHYRGVLRFKPEELQNWQKLLEERRDWLARRGIKYLFVVAPDKQSIYPEHLPAWLTPLRQETKLDQFLAHMRAHSTVEVLDLRGTLRDSRAIAPTYYQTDTHWNQFGAFLSCQEIMKSLSGQLPELPVVPLEAFAMTNRVELDNDLAGMLGLNLAERNAVYLTPKPELPTLDIPFVPRERNDARFSKNPEGRGGAIVFHDSFGRDWPPFLGYAFGNVSYHWTSGLDGPLIEREKPLVVISQTAERFFNVNKPRDLQARDHLP